MTTNDQKKGKKCLKGLLKIFKVVIFYSGNNLKEELWNGNRIYTIEAKDVEYVVC